MILKTLLLGILLNTDTVNVDSLKPNQYKPIQTQDTLVFEVGKNNNIDATETTNFLDSIHRATGDNYTIWFTRPIKINSPLILHHCKLINSTIEFTSTDAVIRLLDSAEIRNCVITTYEAEEERKQDNWGFGSCFVNRSVIHLKGDNNKVDSCTIFRTFGSGISLEHATNSIVRKTKIYDSWVHGYKHGTQGYGINIVESHQNTIELNAIEDTRHGIVIQYNSSNNVIQRNVVKGSYALKKIWIVTFRDYNWTFDITVHGNGAHHNLIQSNFVQHKIYIDNEHLPNGDGNILYQNNAGTKTQIDRGNENQIMIGNYPYQFDKGKNNKVRKSGIIHWK